MNGAAGEREHTTAKLARALSAIPAVPPEMTQRAAAGYYHDFLSPLDFPDLQLITDLEAAAANTALTRAVRQEIRRLAQRVKDGEFDASKEESDEWAASAEGQEALASLTAPRPAGPVTGPAAGAAVKACADLAGRTGARSFECGYVHDGVPADQAGWYAAVKYRGTRITAEGPGPAQACDELAVRLLSGAQCQHCKKLVTLSPLGAVARDVTLVNGTTWTAAEQAAAGLCRWRRDGTRWVRGCEPPAGSRPGR